MATEPDSSESIYLNHAGTSWPKPAIVQSAVNSFLRSHPLEWPAKFASAHRRVADYFRLPDPSRLLITNSCTSALALGIADHPWEAGDRVLTSGWEHHALHRPLVKLASQGVQQTVVGPSSDSPLDLDSLEAELKRGKVRMVAISAASNVTGEVMPVSEVIELSHRFGALVMIDAAQIAGWWDLDLISLEADLVAFAGHKGLQAMWGVGGLFVGPHVKMETPSAQCNLSPNAKNACTTMPGYCDAGSVDQAALASLAAAVEWLSLPEQKGRLDRARALIRQFDVHLRSLPHVVVYGAANANARMPSVAFSIEGRPAAEIASALRRLGVLVAAGQHCAPLTHQTLGTERHGVVRISVGPSQTASDVTPVLTLLTEIASNIDLVHRPFR